MAASSTLLPDEYLSLVTLQLQQSPQSRPTMPRDQLAQPALNPIQSSWSNSFDDRPFVGRKGERFAGKVFNISRKQIVILAIRRPIRSKCFA